MIRSVDPKCTKKITHNIVNKTICEFEKIIWNE